jgi:hypothetical protein
MTKLIDYNFSGCNIFPGGTVYWDWGVERIGLLSVICIAKWQVTDSVLYMQSGVNL